MDCRFTNLACSLGEYYGVRYESVGMGQTIKITKYMSSGEVGFHDRVVADLGEINYVDLVKAKLAGHI